MTREEIIKLAREAGFVDASFCRWSAYSDDLERFAALVAAAERNRIWTQAHWTEYERSIVAAEREACAKLVFQTPESDDEYVSLRETIALAINARAVICSDCAKTHKTIVVPLEENT